MNLLKLKAEIDERMEAIQQEAESKIQALADNLRTEQLIPFCRRHKLTYLAGNGRTVFYNKKSDPVDSTQLPALAPIEEILDIEGIGRNDCLGFYVADIDEEDW